MLLEKVKYKDESLDIKSGILYIICIISTYVGYEHVLHYFFGHIYFMNKLLLGYLLLYG